MDWPANPNTGDTAQAADGRVWLWDGTKWRPGSVTQTTGTGALVLANDPTIVNATINGGNVNPNYLAVAGWGMIGSDFQVNGTSTLQVGIDRNSTRLNSSHEIPSRMPSSA